MKMSYKEPFYMLAGVVLALALAYALHWLDVNGWLFLIMLAILFLRVAIPILLWWLRD